MAQSLIQSSPSIWSYIQPFVIGGFSGCCGASACYPFDFTKTLLQIKSEERGKAGLKGRVSPFPILKEIYKTSGVRGFYRGLDSSIVRQLLFGTTRIGIYKTMFEKVRETEGTVSPAKKVGIALISGFIGAVVGNPADVALVRMQADPALPLVERRNYRNVFDALSRIVREEGFRNLWKGSMPTLVRGTIINLCMLAPYDEIRERINSATNTVDTMSTRLIASSGAGFLVYAFSLPFDNVKTKMQKMRPDAHGKMPYSGITDCFVKSIRREGVKKLWVGSVSYYLRTTPHVIIALGVQDSLTTYFNNRRAY
jgi:solute carrier family 25 oxoglutarate transporter 11